MKDEQAQTLQQLTGVWRLVTTQFRGVSGKVLYPLGEDVQGLAIFDASGYMSAQLMRPDRPEFVSGDQAAGSNDEIRAALQGYTAYYGRCMVDTENKTLTTHVEGSVFPNWVGTDQVRYYELSKGRLTLTTPPIAFGEETFTGVLAWERA